MAKTNQELDANFAPRPLEGGLIYRDVRDTAAAVYGLYGEGYRRMPQAVADAVNEGVAGHNAKTSGGRVRFTTNSRRLGVRMRLADKASFYAMEHMALTGICGADVMLGAGEHLRSVGTVVPVPASDTVQGEFSLPANSAGKAITIELPLYSEVIGIEIGVQPDADILPPPAYRGRAPILFYGSSITHGGCATKPGNSYCNMVGRWLDRDIYVLGFSGSARGEQVMAQYIAGLEMDCFVYDYDHNAPDTDHLQATHLPFLQTVLAAHPGLPVVFMSKPNPDMTGPDRQRRQVIYDSYLWAKAQGTPAVFLDGARLLGRHALDGCTVDGVHPTDLGFYRMAQRVAKAIRSLPLPE